MSIFNKPYKNDETLEREAHEKSRREKYDRRNIELSMADKIYKNVTRGIEVGDKKEWTKEEMIETVRGNGKFNVAEWVTWNKYCNIAIGKIRRKYWNGDEASKRMFNYHRSAGAYVFVDVANELATSEICQEYDSKMRALQKKNKELKESVYFKIAQLSPDERGKLIEELRAQNK